MITLSEEQQQMLTTIRRFVEREVKPVASDMEHRNEYPHALVERMKELGLFGAIIPAEYGGMGLSFTTYAMIIEEICRGWMSLTGILNSHLLFAYILAQHGTNEQKQRLLPAMAKGEKRGGLALTEPHAGSDVQRIRSTAKKRGDVYLLNGSKMFITNGRHGNILAVAAKTDPTAEPPYKGISLFAAEKGAPGLTVSRDIKKLGYKGLDTCELAFEEAIRYSQQRETFGKPICEHQAIQLKLADMATKIEASRLLVYQAATKKDRGERCDLEAGMAKLFASESCQEVALEAMRVLGGYGYTQEFPVERFYRDAPLMIIGEGTSEIQKLVIARNLLQKYHI